MQQNHVQHFGHERLFEAEKQLHAVLGIASLLEDVHFCVGLDVHQSQLPIFHDEVEDIHIFIDWVLRNIEYVTPTDTPGSGLNVVQLAVEWGGEGSGGMGKQLLTRDGQIINEVSAHEGGDESELRSIWGIDGSHGSQRDK